MSVLKKSKVVLVPKKEAAEGCIIRSLGKRLSYPKAQYFTQDYLKHAQLDALHMYVLSEDKPNVGQYYYNKACDVSNPLGPVITKCEYQHEAESCRKYKPEDIFTVIGTTDKSLFRKGTGWEGFVPSPTEAFINKYIESYNKGRIIEEVMVEYEESVRCIKHTCACGLASSMMMCPDFQTQLNPKVRKGNTIIITEIKDSFNREEVAELLVAHSIEGCYDVEDMKVNFPKIMISRLPQARQWLDKQF